MPRRRTRLNWLYDNDLQQFTTPSGQIVTLLQIAQLLQDQVNCSHDFAGPWTGWRIRQNRLIAPGQTFKASQITPINLRAFSRWLKSFEGEQAQLEFHTPLVGHAGLQASVPVVSAPSERHRDTPRDTPAPVNPTTTEASYEPRRRETVVMLDDYRRQSR